MRQKGSLIGDLLNMDVLFGILLGVALPFALWVATQDIPVAVDNAPAQPDNVIHAYQDLISGILALIGAACAVGAVMHQIRDARRMEEERRNRKVYAARAMMSHALAVLSEYAEACCVQLHEALGNARPPKDPEQIKLPETIEPLPSELSIAPMMDFLQYADYDAQDRIAELMRAIQIQHSRLKNRRGHVVDNIVFARWYYTLIGNALEIHARASALFPYARCDTEEIPSAPDKDAIFKAMGGVASCSRSGTN